MKLVCKTCSAIFLNKHEQIPLQLVLNFGILTLRLTMEIKLMTVDVTLRFNAYYYRGKYIIILNTGSIIGKDLLL